MLNRTRNLILSGIALAIVITALTFYLLSFGGNAFALVSWVGGISLGVICGMYLTYEVFVPPLLKDKHRLEFQLKEEEAEYWQVLGKLTEAESLLKAATRRAAKVESLLETANIHFELERNLEPPVLSHAGDIIPKDSTTGIERRYKGARKDWNAPLN